MLFELGVEENDKGVPEEFSKYADFQYIVALKNASKAEGFFVKVEKSRRYENLEGGVLNQEYVSACLVRHGSIFRLECSTKHKVGSAYQNDLSPSR